MIGIARTAILAALLGATAAPAQTPSAADDTIVVNGKRMTKAEVREVARGYARTVLALPQSSQYARWKAPICTKVIGVPENVAAVVIAKVRAEALAAGAKVAKPGCKANLDIVFTDDVDGQMQAILRRRALFFERMSINDRAQLTATGRPIKWFYTVRQEGANGSQLSGESAMIMTAKIDNLGMPGLNARGDATYLSGYDSTLIGSRIRSNFDGAAVIIDVNKAAGRELGAVAAYAALVGLAEIRMTPPPADSDTILTLFDRTAPGGDLTFYDRAFLKAIYSTPANRDRREQVGAITAAMIRILASDTPSG